MVTHNLCGIVLLTILLESTSTSMTTLRIDPALELYQHPLLWKRKIRAPFAIRVEFIFELRFQTDCLHLEMQIVCAQKAHLMNDFFSSSYCAAA